MSVQLCAQRGEDLLLLWLGLSSRWRTYLPVTCAFTRRSGRRGAVMPLRSPQCAQITCTNAPLISLFCMREDLGYAWRQPNKMFGFFFCFFHFRQNSKQMSQTWRTGCQITDMLTDHFDKRYKTIVLLPMTTNHRAYTLEFVTGIGHDHGHTKKTGYNVRGGAPFISMKVS